VAAIGLRVVPFVEIDGNFTAIVDFERNHTLWEDYYDLPFIDETIIRNDLEEEGTLESF
jgi:hypothetical protein